MMAISPCRMLPLVDAYHGVGGVACLIFLSSCVGCVCCSIYEGIWCFQAALYELSFENLSLLDVWSVIYA